MEKEALQILPLFKGKKIAVIGDVILDKYVWGKVDRISPEAPVPVIDVSKDDYKIGAAGNVALNILDLGGKPYLFSVIGNDGYGRMLKDLFKKKKIGADGVIVDSSRKTTLKMRIIAHSQQVVRIDYEDRHPISQEVKNKIINKLRKIKPDVIIVEDYNKGLLTKDLIRDVCRFAKRMKILTVADPHPTRDLSFYAGVDSMTPNRSEAYKLLNAKPEMPVKEIGKKILSELKMNFTLITLGEDGIMVFNKNSIKLIPTRAREVYDVTGAGDTVISIYALALACGAKPETAAALANVGAGIVVSEIGAATVSLKQLKDEIITYEKTVQPK